MITATILADSIARGARLTSLQLRYPRFIHSELLTHRMLSRNSSSSRAIPSARLIDQVRTDPAMPIHWGRNQPGMQASEQIESVHTARAFWTAGADLAALCATNLAHYQVHKQVVNRLLEPYQWMHTIVTATEWANFFALRLHPDAQPELQALAQAIRQAMDASQPQTLEPGQWHLPYIRPEESNLDDLPSISAARCARVSYLNHDQTSPDIAQDRALAARLLASGHLSPFEHQGTPMRQIQYIWSDHGQTSMGKDGYLWSGNLRGWVQHRHQPAAQRTDR